MCIRDRSTGEDDCSDLAEALEEIESLSDLELLDQVAEEEVIEEPVEEIVEETIETKVKEAVSYTHLKSSRRQDGRAACGRCNDRNFQSLQTLSLIHILLFF